MRPVRGVLLDAGDTLIRLRSGAELMHRAATALGTPGLDPAEVTSVWQRVIGRASTPEEMAKGRDLSPEAHRRVWTELYTESGCDRLAPGLSQALYELTVDPRSWDAFPDTLELLRGLRERGLRIGIISDTGFDLRPVFDALGLSPWLDDVVMSFEQGVCKPDPTVFRTACRRLGVAPEETVMVGDNPVNDAGAVHAGLAVLLLPPAAPSEPRGLGRVLSLVSAPGNYAVPPC